MIICRLNSTTHKEPAITHKELLITHMENKYPKYPHKNLIQMYQIAWLPDVHET